MPGRLYTLTGIKGRRTKNGKGGPPFQTQTSSEGPSFPCMTFFSKLQISTDSRIHLGIGKKKKKKKT
jgi:hypothetical protein